MPKLSRLERSKLQKTNPHAPQLLHQPSKVFEHETNLVLTSFNEPHFIPRIFGAPDELDARGRGRFTAQVHTLAELGLLGRSERTIYLDDVNFRDVRGRSGNSPCKFSIICQQQQALAMKVQAADRIDALLDPPQQVHHGRAALWIADRSDEISGLVHQ